MYQSNIDKRIKELEQKRNPQRRNYPICFVKPGEDKAEVVSNHRKQHDIPADAVLHVVSFKRRAK